MENQDSTPQGTSAEAEGRGTPPAKKKLFSSPGRKKIAIVLVIVVLALIGMIGRGFAFDGARGWGNRGLSFGETGNVALVVKDFEPLGIVFAEDVTTSWDGYRTTYDALVKQAAQKGADAIINVNISSTRNILKMTWSGSALAVKYLDTVLEGAPNINQAVEIPNTSSWMRGGWWFGRNRY